MNLQKCTLSFLLPFICLVFPAWQPDPEANPTDVQSRVESTVYTWQNLPVKSNQNGQKRVFFTGQVRDFKKISLEAVLLTPGKTGSAYATKSKEALLIVKEGTLNVTINGADQSLEPGSVALILPGEEHQVKNDAKTNAVFYVMQYQARSPDNPSRGKDAGGSFMLDWNDIEFRPHDKGGIRRFFDRATAMCPRFEMHVTTLNAGLKSHEPHTHRAAEIILMINGHAEMQIGEMFHPGTAGDVYFVESEVSHNIRNTGEKPCMYFAFQFE